MFNKPEWSSIATALLVVAAAASVAEGQQRRTMPSANDGGDSHLTGGGPAEKLDPKTIPKYVIPLVIPPVMNNDGASDSYDIAVREFKQQILPGGFWNTVNGRTDDFPPTTVWSYGPASDDTPTVAPHPDSQFNYPAYTIETLDAVEVRVRWINDLVDDEGRFLEHLVPIDQTLH